MSQSVPAYAPIMSLLWPLFAAAQGPEASADTSGGPSPTSQHQLAPVTINGSRSGGDYSGESCDALGMDLTDREVPQATSVITATRMADFGLRHVNDALAHATGVTVERFETDRTYYTSRGFDITNFQFDGVGLPFTNGNQLGDLDTAVFEQVDVLRGANGLLSATGNPSATVNFIRKRPTFKRRASVALTGGSWRDRRIEGDASGPLDASGSVRGRAIAVRERTGSYLDRYGVDKSVLAGSLDVDLGPATQLALGHLVQRNDSTRPMWGALPLIYADGSPTNYPVSASTGTDWSFWNNTDQRTHAELTHDMGADWKLKAVALYRGLGYQSELFYVYGQPDRRTGLGLTGDAARSTSFSCERLVDIRFTGPFKLGGRSHQALLGWSWGQQHTRAYTATAKSVELPTADLSTWAGRQPRPEYDVDAGGDRISANFRSRRRGLYGAVQLKPADRLGLIVGANFNQVASDGENYGIANGYRNSVLTPYAGVVYTLSEKVSLYGSFTSIFSPQSELNKARQPLDPIQGSNLEAGIKSDWLNKRLSAALALFQARQDNSAEVAGELPDRRPYYRGVNTTSTGFEVEVSGRPLPGWELSAGYAQLRLQDEKGSAAREFVPRRTLRAATSYQPRALPALRLGASLQWQSTTRTSVEGHGIEKKPDALVGLMARYAFNPSLNLTANVNNLFNRKYLNSLYWQWAYYGAPRNVSVNLQATY